MLNIMAGCPVIVFFYDPMFLLFEGPGHAYFSASLLVFYLVMHRFLHVVYVIFFVMHIPNISEFNAGFSSYKERYT